LIVNPIALVWEGLTSGELRQEQRVKEKLSIFCWKQTFLKLFYPAGNKVGLPVVQRVKTESDVNKGEVEDAGLSHWF
jgi:hypothetical protein